MGQNGIDMTIVDLKNTYYKCTDMCIHLLSDNLLACVWALLQAAADR